MIIKVSHRKFQVLLETETQIWSLYLPPRTIMQWLMCLKKNLLLWLTVSHICLLICWSKFQDIRKVDSSLLDATVKLSHSRIHFKITNAVFQILLRWSNRNAITRPIGRWNQWLWFAEISLIWGLGVSVLKFCVRATSRRPCIRHFLLSGGTQPQKFPIRPLLLVSYLLPMLKTNHQIISDGMCTSIVVKDITEQIAESVASDVINLVRWITFVLFVWASKRWLNCRSSD